MQIFAEWGIALYVGVACLVLLGIVLISAGVSRALRLHYEEHQIEEEVPEINPGHFSYWVFLAALWPVTVPLMVLFMIATYLWDMIDPLE